MANKKNRNEKGIRALWFGSNPHSKGDSFSLLVDIVRAETIQDRRYTIPGRMRATIVEIIIKFIN